MRNWYESSWNNAKNELAFTSEEESYKGKDLQTFPPDVGCVASESGGDKSAFTFLMPKDGSSSLVCSIDLLSPCARGIFQAYLLVRFVFRKT